MATKKERLDRIENHLNFMAKCMEAMQKQQMKQLEEQQTIEEVETEPQLEEPIKDMVVNLSRKINDKMQNEKLERNKVIELIENLGGLKHIDIIRCGSDSWYAIFVQEHNHNIVRFTIDLELNSCKANILY